MKISNTHQEFADHLRNQRVIEHPDEFLGPNWKNVLNFWIFLDTLTEEQRKSISDAYRSLSYNECQPALNAALVASYAASDAAWDAGSAAWLASPVARYATHELIGFHILKEQGKSLVFFPMFLNP